MRYTSLPPVGSLVLPSLVWTPTEAKGPREHGATVETIFEHRWGIATPGTESIDGVIREFLDPSKQASAHIVYGGEVGQNAGRCVQMVPLSEKAWTEAADNSEGVSIECADPVWLGTDPHGFARLARITGWLCGHLGLPAVWVRAPHVSHAHGISRHADGGYPDGGHTSCPTTDKELFEQFVERVAAEVKHGGYRDHWAR